MAAGIVYASDVAVSDRVRMVGRFPAASHDAIIYPAVRLTGGSESAAAAGFDPYLVSSERRAPPPAPGSAKPRTGSPGRGS